MKAAFAAAAALCLAHAASAEPQTYKIDPDHTFPSFEADHMGISVWRGKMTKSKGTVVYDKATGDGTVEVSIDLKSIDFGQGPLEAWAIGDQFFDIAKYRHAVYKGRFKGAGKDTPTQVDGELTLHGATKPVALQLKWIKCIPHPLFKRELCGADAYGSFDRSQFGLDAGKEWGFNMEVQLRIQAEAIAQQ